MPVDYETDVAIDCPLSRLTKQGTATGECLRFYSRLPTIDAVPSLGAITYNSGVRSDVL